MRLPRFFLPPSVRTCFTPTSLRFTGRMLGLGVLAALALPPVHFLPVLLFSFGLLGKTLNTATSWKRAAWAGGLFGFGFYAAGLYWLIHAVLIRADEFWWFVPFPSLGCALILAPTAAAPAALSLLAPPGVRRLGAFAALWTLADMSRTFLFSGFTWNALGSCLAIPGVVGDILIQPAAWVGEDGLTLCLVLLSTLAGVACLRGSLLSPRIRAFILGGGAAAVLVWAMVGAARFYTVTPIGEEGPIAVIAQGNVPETEKVGRLNPRDIFLRYLRLTHDGVQQALALDHRPPAPENPADAEPENTGRPIVFLWPETSFPGYDLLQDSPQARAIIMRWGSGAEAGLIGALRVDEQGRYRNAMLAIAPDGTVEDFYDKARLVPFGEYQPPFIPLQIVPQGGMASGPGPRTLHLRGLPPVGPLICYEVIFSGDVTDHHDRPRWLANITNDAWFGNSAGPRQHLASVRLRAVEEGLPIARAANTGISAVYDGRGHLLHSLGWNRTAAFAVPLPAPLPATLFGLHGQTIPLSACIILLVVCISRIRNRKKSAK